MFFYLSFLRPPPVHIAPGPVTITPQVANDLRTELFDGAQDIFYSWSPVAEASLYPKNISGTRPAKLTAWRSSNAYKEISVPPPPGVREGQSWRLVLTAQAQGNPIIPLAGAGLGASAFPVLSMPILFSARHSKGKASVKQEQVERIYRFPVPALAEQALVVIREQTSFDLDKKIWDSGIGLSGWLVDLFNDKIATAPLVHELKTVLGSPDSKSFVELGAGTGIVSLVVGALRSSPTEPDNESLTRILTTDLPSAMPLLSHNITVNSHLSSPAAKARPEAVILDWDESDLPDEVLSLNAGIDVILMADVTYNTASFPSLVRTLSSLVNYSVSKSKTPLILLGYKERDPAERELWEMVKDFRVEFAKVDERPGSGGAPVEVWIGTVVSGRGDGFVGL